MANWDDIRREWETTKITLKDLADKHGVKLGTLKSRRSREKWSRDATKKVATKSEKVATITKRMQPKKEDVPEQKKAVEAVESIELENGDFTNKQRLFISYYVKYWNATKAYQKAYKCSRETALVNGPRLLGNARIKEEVIRVRDSLTEDALLNKRTLIQKWIDIAFADITDYVEFGRETMTDPETGMEYEVNRVKFKESTDVDGTIITEVRQGKDGVSVKLADKMKALEMLSKYFDLLSDNDKKRLQEEKLRMDIEKTKAEVAHIKGENETYEDDGFIEALDGKVEEIWSDGDE